MNAYWTGGSTVVALRRDAAGQLVRREFPADHCCYLRARDVSESTRRQLSGSRAIVGVRDEGEWVRLSFANRDVARKLTEKDGYFADRLGLETFEGDLDPMRRWQLDERVAVARPRRAYLDLEADARVPFRELHRMRVLCWSIAELVEHRDLVTGEISREAVTVATGTLDGAGDDAAERELLRALWRELEAFDQVVAWNGDRFDFPLLAERTRRAGLPVEWRRWLWLDHMVLYLRLNASASESGDEKQFQSLDAIAQAVLGEKKRFDFSAHGAAYTWKLWAAGGRQRDQLAEGCADDAAKLARLEAKTGYVELHHTLCESTGVFPDTRAIGPKIQVETFLMRLGLDRGMHFPTSHYRDMQDGEEDDDGPKYKGADVIASKFAGMLHDVHVGDFARLYPSIIVSLNMSPETWVDYALVEDVLNRPSYLRHLPPTRHPLPEGCCFSPATNAVFRKEPQGLLPIAVLEMLRRRKYWDDLKASLPHGTEAWKDADRRSAAYKIAANSFYGVVGSKYSRFYLREVAESTARTGAWLLQAVSREAEARGFKVVYGDTDSVFVTRTTRSGFAAFVDWCNAELFPRLMAECSAPTNAIKLAYEKAFELVLFVEGSKRYAGRYSHFKGKDASEKSKPEIKGFEYKRGDSAQLARRLQAEVLDRILGGGLLRPRVERCDSEPGPFEALLDEWRDRVLKSELARDEVVLSKKLAKGLGEYERGKKKDGTDAALPAHVEVALELAKRGRDVGAGVRIEYVVVDGDASPQKRIPAEDWEPGAAFDRFYLWDNLIFPPTQRILEAAFPASNWRRWERTRPPKPRGAAARLEAAGQASFLGREPAPAPAQRAPAPAAARPPAKPPARPPRGAPPPGQRRLF